MRIQDSERLLTPAEVARRFGVDPKTVTRWAKGGKLPFVLTPGGSRRYEQKVIDGMCVSRYENDQPAT